MKGLLALPIKFLCTLLLAGIASQSLFAQVPANSEQARVAGFFPAKNLMTIGVYYYPEQWPATDWGRDLANIKKLGFEFTHFAEFAWTYIEPSENNFDFAWLDSAIALAQKAGLRVILCTPTAAPPAWMGEKYPEIYLVDEKGRRREHGNRANQSVTNEKYLQYADRVVAALAQRYGHNPNVMGWQVDNEPGATADYSPSARRAFQQWLQARYGTIDSLNQAWVGSFWSTRYDSFSQIGIPNTSIYVEDKLSPHTVLDFKRFTADAQAAFINRQADTLHKYIGPNQWVTTNYTNVVYDADPRRSAKLDFTSFTMYPVNGTNIAGGNSFRTGSPYKIAEATAYYRSIKGVTGVMELQPGQVNWAPINPQPIPGAVHMWLLHAFAGGCSFACTYRYRHPLGSSEMYHDGIVGTDGVTLENGGKEFVQAIGDMKKLRANYDGNSQMPAAMAKRKTAFLWDHENLWDLENQPQTTAWDTWGYRNKFTAAVKSTAAPVDFISETDNFEAYPFLVAPAYQLVSQTLVDKWVAYVQNGGHLILSCRTGQKDKNGHFFAGKLATHILPLIGADLEFFDMLVPGVTGNVKSGQANYTWNTWAEILSPHAGTKVLATYANQFYAGKAAAITRRMGKGSVTYIGVQSLDGTLERDIIRSVYKDAGVAVEDLPAGVYMEWRDGFFTAVNYIQNQVKVPIAKVSHILVGANPLKQGQAVVWKP